ncbi:hypothetical protein [Vibrio gazogenes]|uniref:Uncharacterized protein n=1 Tax=Vibrio gazogenes DSM 21264 = NBRC 103151 TaxID=1123492 RepID=A0A1M4T148_VIBGA|nr:hypothetical protein [Vibrio gazogenes]USP15991.1 hypothetical protein MKS89_16515 [Vibrio gazogenes]SHE38090.1 hypothetical protein SAMN02745781_00204 [Vibrio gazogenes DSM 21264] [Vibrio gazogenes DSM 21264 = NBRC 103151]SJN54715.1 hypothetical protein BQ6471_01166 [Vibrio gazogenes]
MVVTLFWLEKSMLTLGIILIVMSMIRYGKRSQDWRGIATMFFKRIPMTIEEYRHYRFGVALVVLAVLLRIVTLTLWPTV